MNKVNKDKKGENNIHKIGMACLSYQKGYKLEFGFGKWFSNIDFFNNDNWVQICTQYWVLGTDLYPLLIFFFIFENIFYTIEKW